MTTSRSFAAFIFLLAVATGQDLHGESSARHSDINAGKRAEMLDSIVVDHAARYSIAGAKRHSDGPLADAVNSDVPSTSTPPRFMRRQRQVQLGDDGEHVDGVGSGVDTNEDDYEMPEALLQDADQLSESQRDGVGGFYWDRRRRRRRVDCSYSTWTAFTKCTKTCGTGVRKRTRYRKPAVSGGKACAFAETFEQFSCNAKQCPVNCAWSKWGAWGVCSHTCGNGQKTRTRFGSGPFHGGAACSGGGTATLGCNTFACPQDCYFQPWSQWGACTKTCVHGGEWGYKTRYRSKIGPFNGGVACVGHTVDDNTCNGFTCPVDCSVSQWTSWSSCTQTCSVSVLTHGYKIRSRTSTAATNGGKMCAANWQMEHCNNFLCSFDCYWLDWGGWGPCSRTCTLPGEAAGQRVKIRSMVGPGMGGKACVGNTEQNLACNDFMCPQDCKWNPWGSFGTCSKTCGTGGRTRTRDKELAKYGGIDCTGPSSHWEACNGHGCPVDCKWTEWNAWMPCTRTCGPHGTRQRARSYDPSPVSGGAGCEGSFLEMAECNMFPCPVDCRYEDWLEWSLCSVSCNDGVKTRMRLKNISEWFGGSECPEEATEETSCFFQSCPLDCRFSEWGNWTECSATCGKGSRMSVRTLMMAELGGSEECPEGDNNRTEECNEAPCAPEKAGASSLHGQLAQCVILAVALRWYIWHSALISE